MLLRAWEYSSVHAEEAGNKNNQLFVLLNKILSEKSEESDEEQPEWVEVKDPQGRMCW